MTGEDIKPKLWSTPLKPGEDMKSKLWLKGREDIEFKLWLTT